MQPAPARLVLEDGTAFDGYAFGAEDVRAVGLVAVHAANSGLAEILTDPSYQGILLCLAYPHAGNAGLTDEDFESLRAHAAGVAVRECSRAASNWRSRETLDEFLRRSSVPGIQGIDTRRLVRHLAEHGAMRGALATGREAEAPVEELQNAARNAPERGGPAWLASAGTRRPYTWSENVPAYAGAAPVDVEARAVAEQRRAARFSTDRAGRGLAAVAVLDLGVKRQLLRWLVGVGAQVTVYPGQTSAEELLRDRPAGVVFSSGPGEPERYPEQIETARALLGRLPLWGVGLGAGVVAAATGVESLRLPRPRFGQAAVRRLSDDFCGQAASARTFGWDEESLTSSGWRVTLREVDPDPAESGVVGAVLRAKGAPAWATLYQIGGAPGPADMTGQFAEFMDAL